MNLAFTRKNVWDLGDSWAPEILWYARGVKAMQARPLADRNGWRFWAAIHGFEQALWKQIEQWSPREAMPATADVQTFWEQCQHASWYFLPWHRGYLIAFEAQIRAAIKTLGGPADSWALPYWNYFKPNQNLLPKAFASPDWPDGNGNNPLFVTQRYGPDGDGNVYVDLKYVDLKALSDDHAFIGAWKGTPTGFGGPQTRFEHGDSGTPHGGLEHQPHEFGGS
jgi:tyrosinase